MKSVTRAPKPTSTLSPRQKELLGKLKQLDPESEAFWRMHLKGHKLRDGTSLEAWDREVSRLAAPEAVATAERLEKAAGGAFNLYAFPLGLLGPNKHLCLCGNFHASIAADALAEQVVAALTAEAHRLIVAAGKVAAMSKKPAKRRAVA